MRKQLIQNIDPKKTEKNAIDSALWRKSTQKHFPNENKNDSTNTKIS